MILLTSTISSSLHSEQVQTDGKIPSAPPQQVSVEPLGRQQLLVAWRPPDHTTWNGDLLGYTIGLRRISSHPGNGPELGPTNYTRVGIPGGEIVNDFRLTDLEKYTQYSITVAAFNAKGDGPASEPVIARTIEDGQYLEIFIGHYAIISRRIYVGIGQSNYNVLIWFSNVSLDKS